MTDEYIERLNRELTSAGSTRALLELLDRRRAVAEALAADPPSGAPRPRRGLVSAATALHRLARSRPDAEAREDPRYATLLAEAVAALPQVAPQGLASTAWAMATLRVGDAKLLHALSEVALVRLPECGPREVANIAWSFARLQVQD